MKTSGNNVLITAGGTGIGLSLARRLVASENTVAICGRRRPVFFAAKRMIPNLKIKVCDSPVRAIDPDTQEAETGGESPWNRSQRVVRNLN